MSRLHLHTTASALGLPLANAPGLFLANAPGLFLASAPGLLLASALGLLSAGAAGAGPLADPTRPPAALMAPGGLAAAALPHRANLDTARALAAAARAADAAAPPAAVATVQAVQLPANLAGAGAGAGAAAGTPLALVDGRQVKVGDLVDGRAVLAIDAQGLLLKGPRGPERLWLLAGTPKQAAGSITDSRTARYQPAAPADLPTGQPGEGQATGTAGRGQIPLTPTNISNPGNPGNLSTPSAAPGSLSLAGKTAP